MTPKAYLLGFLGMIDVEFVYAEGRAMGNAEPQIAAVACGRQQVQKGPDAPRGIEGTEHSDR